MQTFARDVMRLGRLLLGFDPGHAAAKRCGARAFGIDGSRLCGAGSTFAARRILDRGSSWWRLGMGATSCLEFVWR